jgi:acyl-coenzyme A synthetase/AMP-(fatty) acid ligase/acyl carrier protein
LQFAPLTFDASVSEIAMTLASGGTLCLAPALPAVGVSRFSAWMNVHRVEFATFPPTVLSLFDPEALRELRTIIVAGEPCSVELAKTWSNNRRLFNAYGPTECTVCATIGEYQGDSLCVPIGKPIANVEIFILNKEFQSVPAGTTGEIFIGGVGVARGYLNDVDLTSGRFVHVKFADCAQVRLFRTGDLACFRQDGSIEFIGREDTQVKLRGIRVELSEIESLLQICPQVRQCAVVLQPQSNTSQVIAYVSLNDSESDTLSCLAVIRNFLRVRLPVYMMPMLIPIPSLPVTRHGKVDRAALLDLAKSYRVDESAEPQSDTEQQLATVWQKLLGVSSIGLHDQFTDVGGDSLSAIRMVVEVEARWGIEINLGDLIAAGTLSLMASEIDKMIANQNHGGSDDESAAIKERNNQSRSAWTKLFLE